MQVFSFEISSIDSWTTLSVIYVAPIKSFFTERDQDNVLLASQNFRIQRMMLLLVNIHTPASMQHGTSEQYGRTLLQRFLVTKVTKHCMANGMICGSIKGTCTVMCHCHKQQRRKAKAQEMKIMYQCVFDVLLF